MNYSLEGKIFGKAKARLHRLKLNLSGSFAENWQKFQYEKLMPRIKLHCEHTRSHIYKLDNVNSFDRLFYFKSMHFPDSPDLSEIWIEYLKYKMNAEHGDSDPENKNTESEEIVENLNNSISKIKGLNLDLAIDTQNLLTSLANSENM